MAAASASASVIDQLAAEYSKPAPHAMVVSKDGSVCSTESGVLGEHTVTVQAKTDIRYTDGACVAAPRVTMIAGKHLQLGSVTASEKPTRLYASTALSITAEHVKIGHFELVGDIKFPAIFCKRLTLAKPVGTDDPAHFAVIKSGLLRDDTVVKVVELKA